MKKISYNKLSARQKENYNFQKISAILADYGFNTLRLSDDWQGADFIANHIDGNTFLKVQLKGRFTISKKYIGKEIWVGFPHKGGWYLYPHDIVVEELRGYSNFENTQSWRRAGTIHNANPSKKDLEILKPYKL
ncbi:hypothetical protein HOG17_02945 [Candidatus Peregrinibacteria bacterium]|jgi:hypothetical protein|nr:hypothetical protein [Candidatus Peregrinibacteria bacterium]MBT4148546.1 hypothetical protein [Candidatus Peregrinibacteria bacterium]MBT4456142.1 hypothetical protein [Candidatus Peregrinibacteria bacterium]